MRESYDILRAIGCRDQRSVLATIIRIEGSAYRKQGVSMLISEDGEHTGVLSAGCLEEDLAARANGIFTDREAFDRGDARLLIYDMRAEDDLGWGSAAGCNGVLQVLLEPIHPRLRADFREVLDHVEKGRKVTGIRSIEGDISPALYCFYADDGSFFGSGFKDRHRMDDSRQHQFMKTWQPRPRLLVIGAGPDARPLVAMASRIGFTVWVIDRRPAFCTQELYPDAERCSVGGVELLSEYDLTPNDYVVIMTHHFKTDRQWLQRLLGENIRYLGLLGSRDRALRLLNVDAIPSQVRTPVGLTIGAEGPDEIAVSILADLIRVYRCEPAEGL
jgi:xanthine dehydrogenase accessory factor